MILMISYANRDRKHYIVKDFSDLSPIFEAYPKTQRIALYSHSLEDAVKQIAQYINNGYTEAWVEDGLNKSLREKAAALGLAASMIVNPVNTSHLQDRKLTPADQKEQVKKPETDFGSHPADGFLWNLKQIETSGGKNLKHPVVKHGVAKGSRAMGNWGLLKPTVNEIVNRMRLAGNLTPEYAKLAHMDRDKMEEHLKKNPQVELDLVRNLAGHVLKRNKGDLHRAAYAWNTGHNKFPDQIHNDVLLNSDYVQKFKSADKVNPYKVKAKAKAPLAKTIEAETDFKVQMDQWLKVREEQKTKHPTRSSNFQPDPGVLRDQKLDEIKPQKDLSSKERLLNGIKEANKK